MLENIQNKWGFELTLAFLTPTIIIDTLSTSITSVAAVRLGRNYYAIREY